MKIDSQATAALLKAVELGYKISKQGTVTNPKGKILGGDMPRRYKVFSVSLGGGKQQHVRYHVFQAYMKFGDDIFETEVVRHLNDNPEDNSWDNIEIGSHSDNANDRVRNGKCVNSGASIKLTDEQMIDVFYMLKQGCTRKFICMKYGWHKYSLGSILTRCKYYKELTKDL